MSEHTTQVQVLKESEDQEMKNMFASVWVKVEVNADDNTEHVTNFGDHATNFGDIATNFGDIATNFGVGITNFGELATNFGEPVTTIADVTPYYSKPRKKQVPSTTTLYCNDCDYTTTLKHSLSIHMVHHAKPLTCNLCDYTNKFKRDLEQHMAVEHNIIRKPARLYACDQCDYTSPYKYNVRGHKRKHSLDKRFQCSQCEFKTSYKHNFLKHSRTHQGPGMYKCPQCPFESKYQGYVQRHLAQIHKAELNNPNVCEWCGFSNKERWRLKMHQQRSKVNEVIQCNYCGFETFYKCEYKSHRKTHFDSVYVNPSDLKMFIVAQTGTDTVKASNTQTAKPVENVSVANSKPNLNCIENVTDPKLTAVFKCDGCQYATDDKYRLKTHVKKNLSDTVQKCFYCGFETYYLCESKKHKNSAHYCEIYGNGRSVDCTNLRTQVVNMICSKQTEQFTETPQNLNSDSKPIENTTETPQNLNLDSKQIEKSTETQQNLDLAGIEKATLNSIDVKNETENGNKGNKARKMTEHSSANNYSIDPNCVDFHSIQVLDSEDPERPFQCTFCNYKSKFKSSVQRHFQRHHTGKSNRPYVCINCDFSAKTKDQISLHNKRSKSDKELTCPNCDFKTYYKCAHKMHEKSHFNHKCSLCNYSCKFKFALIKHFATYHMGDGIKCQYCDYRAARKESILCHETVHTGFKPFKCQFCEYSSVRKALLETHLRRTHGNEIKELISKNLAKKNVDRNSFEVHNGQNEFGNDQDVLIEGENGLEEVLNGFGDVQNGIGEVQNRLGEVQNVFGDVQNRFGDVQNDRNRFNEVRNYITSHFES